MGRQLTKIITLALAIILCATATMSQTPQVVLRTTDGRTVSLAESRGTIIVLSFGATWAPRTERELPALQRLANFYVGRGVAFYWVSINGAKARQKGYTSDRDLQAFADELGLRLPVLRDPDRKAFRAFGLDALPATVIIDRDGRVGCTVVGVGPKRTRTRSPVMRCLNKLLASGA